MTFSCVFLNLYCGRYTWYSVEGIGNAEEAAVKTGCSVSILAVLALYSVSRLKKIPFIDRVFV